MDWSKLADAPLANLCLLAGILFLFFALGWRPKRQFGHVQPVRGARVTSGVLGVLLVSAGILIHIHEPAKVSVEYPGTPDEQPLRLNCEAYGLVRSENGDTVAALEIANRTSQPLKATWVDYDGKESSDPQLHVEIRPGETERFNSFVTHVWLLGNRNGCVGLFKLQNPMSKIIIK